MVPALLAVRVTEEITRRRYPMSALVQKRTNYCDAAIVRFVPPLADIAALFRAARRRASCILPPTKRGLYGCARCLASQAPARILQRCRLSAHRRRRRDR